MTTATTNLFGHLVSGTARFTANDRQIRRFALAKVMRNVGPGGENVRKEVHLLGGREDAESGAALDRYAEGLKVLCGYVREQGHDIRFAIEPKANEPRGDTLLPRCGTPWPLSVTWSTVTWWELPAVNTRYLQFFDPSNGPSIGYSRATAGLAGP